MPHKRQQENLRPQTPTRQNTVGRQARTRLRASGKISTLKRVLPTAGKKRRLRQEYGKIPRAQLIRSSRATASFPPGPYSGYTASDESILSSNLPASFSPYIGRPAAKAARRITRHCQKTIRAVFEGWGSLRGKGPFSGGKRALPPQIHLSAPPTHHRERTKSRMRSSL